MNIRVFEALYIVATSHILTFWCSIPKVSAAFPIQLSIFLQHFYFTSIYRRKQRAYCSAATPNLGVCCLHEDWRCPWNQRNLLQDLELLSIGRIQDAQKAIVDTNMRMNEWDPQVFIPQHRAHKSHAIK